MVLAISNISYVVTLYIEYFPKLKKISILNTERTTKNINCKYYKLLIGTKKKCCFKTIKKRQLLMMNDECCGCPNI